MWFIFKPILYAFLVKEMRTVREFNYFLAKFKLIPANHAALFIKTNVLDAPFIHYFQIPHRWRLS